MKEILQGCLYLHERKICHRDIKPQNILMHNGTSLTYAGTAKLSDFGFATCL
jgi:serine/threonine protein kinase